MDRTAPETKVTTKSGGKLYMSLELSKASWKLAFSDGGQRVRTTAVPGGEIGAVLKMVASAKAKFKLAENVPTLSCYEAGRDGFWIHRALTAAGIGNVVVDAASIEVDRRQRRAKTDRIDAQKLVQQLVRHDERGDRLRVVRVPTPEDEDARRPGRELERLKKERTGHTTRVIALLALHGISGVKVRRGFGKLVRAMRGPSGEPLPAQLTAELAREAERLEVVRTQIRELETARVGALTKPTKAARMATSLMLLRAVGVNSATVLAYEFFSWREFKNGKQVGASAGMTGVPYDSGGTEREQGISKAGNRRVRALAIELAWGWLRYQPGAHLSHWYMERFGRGSSRARRVGIVALARKLLVALWRYVDQGIVPDGARMKTET